jgi:hypothetical protein
MIAHDKFVLGYEIGRLGCSVSVLLTLRLFLTGKIRDKTISIRLLLWAVGFLALIAASVIAFLKLPIVWAFLCTAACLAIFAFVFFYSVGELVLSVALAKEDFYTFVTAQAVLRPHFDNENNLPKVQN